MRQRHGALQSHTIDGAYFSLSGTPDNCRSILLQVLEEFWIELMSLQQLVELRAIALRQPRCLRHITVGNAQYLGEIFALELAPRFLERRELALLMLYRLLHKRDGYQGRR